MSKIWFITGASRGLGAEIARAVLASGDRVAATGRDAEALAAAYAEYGSRVLPIGLDVTDPAQAEHAVQLAVGRYGSIDVLVNNAGYGQLGAFEENDAGQARRQFDTNVFGTFHVTRAVLPVMRRQRSGHILNVSSIGGLLGFRGCALYCATKFAIEGFSESLALEVRPFGIHVTVVEPGFFRTDFLDGRSVSYGALQLDDYAKWSGQTRADYEGYSHRQPGDPARLGRALVRLAAEPEPPLHYLAGSDALEMAQSALQRRSQEIERWRALSLSTDIAAEPAAA